MASKGRKGQWGWYREHKFSYCLHFIIQEWNTLKNVPTSFHVSEKDQMQVLLRADSHQASVTAGLEWAEHSQKPITAMIFIFNRIFPIICNRIFLMFITAFLKVYFILF